MDRARNPLDDAAIQQANSSERRRRSGPAR
jgi:hypothetical protein